MTDESKPQEYYEQLQVLEEYEDLETAKGSKYYDLFAQMQEIAEESWDQSIEERFIGQIKV